jgi:Tfp pilus assembly protein PilF
MKRTPLGLALLCTGLIILTGACAREGGDLLTQGLQQHSDGKLDDAAATYRRLLDEEPSNKLAWYNLGLVEQTQGDNRSATASYRKALAIDKEFVPAMFNIAVIETTTKPSGAVVLYEKIIKIEPDHAAAHLNLGFLLKKLKEVKRGNEELRKAVELDPSLASRLAPRPSQGPATPAP